jgi:hypothetical protein
MFQYVVKIVCGVCTQEVNNDMLAPGQYWTAINIYNPSQKEEEVARFEIRIAIAEPVAAGTTGTTGISFDVQPILELKSGNALEIDCGYIIANFEKAGNHQRRFLKGFVVIKSKFELDVVAVYTAAKHGGSVVTLHTERVSPRVR